MPRECMHRARQVFRGLERALLYGRIVGGYGIAATRIVRVPTQSANKLRGKRPCDAKILEPTPWHVQCRPGITSDPSKEEIMSADQASKKLKQDLEATRKDLRRAADEIRVKMHLAGMDAKDAWEDIQPRLEDFERRFDAKADEVTEELKALGSDIKKRLLSIKAKLS